MVITFLGSGRISGTKVDRVVDSLGSSANGTNSGITLTNDKLGYKILRKNSNESISYDIGTNLNATTWTCRLKLKNTSLANIETGANLGFFGISDKDYTVASDGSQDWIGFLSRCSNTEAEYFGHSVNDSTLGEAGTQMGANDIITSNLTTEWGWEIKRTGETTAVVTLYPNWNFTGTPTATVNLTVSSSYSALRYFVIRNFINSTAKTTNLNGYVEEIKIWNGTNDTTTTPLYTSSFPTKTGWTAQNENNIGISKDTKLGTGAYSLSGANPVHFPDANNNKLLPATGDFSITCWIYHTGHNDHQQIFRCQDSNGSSEGEFRINSSGTSSQEDRLALSLPITSSGTVMSTNAVPQNEWVHCAVTRTGATVKLYINGTIETNQNTSGTFNATSAWGDDTPRIGRMESANETIQGKIDDLSVWHRVLTATEILDLVNSVESTPTVTTLDSTNGTTDWAEVGSRYTIDTSNNQIDFALVRDNSGYGTTTALYDLGASSMLNDTEFVLRFRLNFGTIDDPSRTPSVQFVFGAYSNTDGISISQDSITMFCGATSNTGNNWNFGVTDANGAYSQNPNVAFDASGTGVTGNNNWYVEIVRTSASAGVARLYSDSTYETLVQEKSLAFSSSNPQNLRYIGAKQFGSNSTATPTYNGYMSDVKIWNGTTSASTNDGALVSSLSNKANLKAYYSMNSTSLGATVTKETLDSTNGVTGWTSSANDFTVDSSNNEIDITGATNSETIAYDLGSDVSTSAWLLRFKTTWAGSQSSNPITWFSVSDTNTGGGASNQDGVNLMYYAGSYWKASSNDGSRPDQASDQNNLSPQTSADTTNYWCEISRNGSNYTCSIYPNDSYATATATLTQSIGSIAGLQYFRAISYGQGSGRTGTLSDVKFYDGVSSLDGCKNDFSATSALDGYTNLVENSIFKQTDDTPTYWWKQSDNSWLKSPWAIPATFTDTFTSDNWNDKDSSEAGVNTSTNRLEFQAKASGIQMIQVFMI